MVGVRIDRKRKQSVTVLLKALGWTEAQILEQFGDVESMRETLEKDHTADQRRGAARHLPQAAAGRAADRGGRAEPARQPLLQRQALRPGQGRPLQDQQEAGPRASRCRASVLSIDDIVATIRFLVTLHAGGDDHAGHA